MNSQTAMLTGAIETNKCAKSDGGPLRVLRATVGTCFVFGAHLKLAKNLFRGIHLEDVVNEGSVKGVGWNREGKEILLGFGK